jgi:GAF domain-containing protein
VSYPIWVIDGRVLTDEHARPTQDGLIEHILTSREPLLLNGDVGEQMSALGITRSGPACLSFLGVPVVNDGEAVGVLALQDHDFAGRYGRHELGVLNIIATQAGAAVRNARLFSATRRAYEELSATQARLLESERLRGVTETVGALNHEVNNPLATLVGTAQLLLRLDDLDELTRTRLERMLEAAKRIQTVTARMSTIIQATSRPYPGEDTILDVRASLAWMDAAAGPESAELMRRDARGAVVAPPSRPDSQAA